MKVFATTSILVVAALAALAPVASAGLPSNTQSLSPRERFELNQRYPQTHGLAPSPEALAARAPDLVERYVTSHPSGSSVTSGRYVETLGLAPSPEALAARTYTKTYGLAPSPEALAARTYTKTYGLAPSPEALAARTTTTSGGGIDWGDFTVIGGGVLFLALLLATGATVALRHSRGRYASV